MKHVVLRRMEQHQRNFNGRVPTAEVAMTNPTRGAAPATPHAIEVAQIGIREAKSVAREANVAAVAPVMPMKLIQPFEVVAAADPLAGGITWGIHAVGADTSPFNGDGIVVAVLDTGIDPTHPAFAGVELVRKNFTSGSEDDVHGHGTHCAGTIFGRDVNGTRIGVARGVKKALIGKVLGPDGGGSDVVVEGIKWATENGAHVISMSLGIDFPGFVEELIQQEHIPAALATSMALDGYRSNIKLFETLAEFLNASSLFTNHPTLLVAAAGNESQRDVDAQFEIAVSPPAASTGIVSVAALQIGAGGFSVATFSNTGARVSGPGVDIVSAKRGGGLVSMSGTSMATPHVAGVAVLWAQKLRQSNQLVADRLADRLVGSAIQTGFVNPFDPTDIGLGIVQAPQS